LSQVDLCAFNAGLESLSCALMKVGIVAPIGYINRVVNL